MDIYDSKQWIEHFHMPKNTMLDLCKRLASFIAKKDTHFCLALHVHLRIFYGLYKFAQRCTVLACSEKFVIGRSTIGTIIQDFVWGMTQAFRHVISWHVGDRMWEVMLEF